MRVKKIQGEKDCICCGKTFGYFNRRNIYCSRHCEIHYKYYGKIRSREITLAYIPDHLIIKKGAVNGY